MTPLETGLLFLGVLLGCVVLARVLSAGWFQVTRKPRIDVRIDPDFRMDEERERLKAAAIWKGYRRPE